MSIMKYLQTSPINEISRYNAKENYRDISVPYLGTPRKHPYDESKIILVTNPLTDTEEFCEFKLENIVHVEYVKNMVTKEGMSMSIIEIWVELDSYGVKYIPFKVQARHVLNEPAESKS